MQKWILKNKDAIIKIIITVIATVIAGIILDLLKIISKSFIDNKNQMFVYFEDIFNLSISIRIYHILIIIIIWFFVSFVYRKIKDKIKKLKIIEAKYYTNLHSLDITRELNESVEKDKLKIVLSNNIAGDPHKGFTKRGLIKYRLNGKIDEKTYKEGEVINIE